MGVWDVAALARDMFADQYRAWMEYASIEPFGEVQADLRAGAIARVVAEPNRDRAAHPAPFTVLDFIPWIMTEERLAEQDAMRESSPEDRRVYVDGEEWPEANAGQLAAAEQRAMILAGIDPDEISVTEEYGG